MWFASGECYCRCARANLIEAGVLPWLYQTRERLLLGQTPSTLQLLMAQHRYFESPKEQDEASYNSVCTYNLSWKPPCKKWARPFWPGATHWLCLFTSIGNCSQSWSSFVARNWLAGQSFQYWFCHPVKITFLHSLSKEISDFNTEKLQFQFALS